MKSIIVVFDNLVEQHSSGIAGLNQNVRAVCSPEDLPGLEEVGLRARQAAERLQRMFQTQQ